MEGRSSAADHEVAPAHSGRAEMVGDPAVLRTDFDALFLDLFRELVRAVMYLGADHQEAEDAAQEAMMVIYQRWSHVRNRNGYARRVAVRAFIRGRTRGSGRPPSRPPSRQPGRSAPASESADDEGLDMWEGREWVDQVLATLPPAQREVMSLIVDGHTPGEIAEALGLAPGTVRQRVTDARRSLEARPDHAGIVLAHPRRSAASREVDR